MALNKTLWLTTIATVLTLGAADTAAQERYRILVPDFAPGQGANDDFGEDAAEALRGLIASLPTHRAIEKDELEDRLDDFDLDMDDLNCVRTRQLASQIDAEVALCASYTPADNGNMTVAAEFWDIASSESFTLEPTAVPERDTDAAARYIFDQFDAYQRQFRAAAICGDYAQSQQWEAALRNCDEALEVNPDAAGTRYQRGRILFEMERFPEALQEMDRVLEQNPMHEEALQLAGYIAASEGMDDRALDYYTRFLDLRPESAPIRMRIAYEVAQAGNPRSAMQLIEEGLEVDPENVDLLEQYGGFAFAAGLQVQEGDTLASDSPATDSVAADSTAAAQAAEDLAQDAADADEPLSPEAEEYFRSAIDAYNRVYEIRGPETRPGQLRNIVAAHLRLGEPNEAISTAERALETHPEDESLWSTYADALKRSDRLDDAITALERVKEINPEHPTVALRQGSWLIEAGRVEEAGGLLSEVAADSPEQAENAAQVIFSEAYNNGVQQERFDYAAQAIAVARGLPNVSEQLTDQLEFWEGYSIFQGAVREQEASTVESARATLPKFQEALGLVQQSGEYATSVNVSLAELVDNINTYIEIQEAIIRRGGGSTS